MSDNKYEIKGSFGDYQVLYGSGYPCSEFIRYTCLTMRSAKRAIRRHKRKMQRGGQPAARYGIVYTEEVLSDRDVQVRIEQLERELGIRP